MTRNIDTLAFYRTAGAGAVGTDGGKLRLVDSQVTTTGAIIATYALAER
jgi:hypothetical protein